MRSIPTPKGLFIHDRQTGLCLFTPDVKAEGWIKPLYAQIAITDYCPLSCPYCYTSASPANAKFMSKQQLLKLAGFLDEWGVFGIALGGGEPFTHPELGEIAREIWTETGLDLSITSNGLCLSEPVLDALEGYVGEVRVTIHAPACLEALPKLLERRFQVGVNILLLHGEAEKLRRIVQRCLQLGVRDFLVNSFLPAGRGLQHKHLEPEAEDYQKLAETIRMLQGRAEFKVSGRLAEKLRPYRLKFMPFTGEERGSIIAITLDGKVKPTSLSNEEYPFTKPEEIPKIYEAMLSPF